MNIAKLLKPIEILHSKDRIQVCTTLYNLMLGGYRHVIVLGDLDVPRCGIDNKALKKMNLLRVGGSIDLCGNQLTSLKGMPEEVLKDANLSRNQISSLKSQLCRVGGIMDLTDNCLRSLDGCPEDVGLEIKVGLNFI